MNNQEIFNKVWQHAVVENQPLSYKGIYGKARITCEYRGQNGSRCWIGVVMPDEAYNPKFDTNDYPRATDVLTLRRFYPRVRKFLHGAGREFLKAIQEAHDIMATNEFYDWHETKSARERLMVIATDYGLHIPESESDA